MMLTITNAVGGFSSITYQSERASKLTGASLTQQVHQPCRRLPRGLHKLPLGFAQGDTCREREGLLPEEFCWKQATPNGPLLARLLQANGSVAFRSEAQSDREFAACQMDPLHLELLNPVLIKWRAEEAYC